MFACYKCGTAWEGEGEPLFKATCAKCNSYLHCCKNCRLHDPHAHNQCISSTTEEVEDREGANFCDEFEFRKTQKDATKPKGSGRDKWDKLFGGK